MQDTRKQCDTYVTIIPDGYICNYYTIVTYVTIIPDGKDTENKHKQCLRR